MMRTSVSIPVEVLLQEQGGAESKSARIATARHVEKCVAMGAKLIQKNPMTERNEVYRVKR